MPLWTMYLIVASKGKSAKLIPGLVAVSSAPSMLVDEQIHTFVTLAKVLVPLAAAHRVCSSWVSNAIALTVMQLV